MPHLNFCPAFAATYTLTAFFRGVYEGHIVDWTSIPCLIFFRKADDIRIRATLPLVGILAFRHGPTVTVAPVTSTPAWDVADERNLPRSELLARLRRQQVIDVSADVGWHRVHWIRCRR